jgi:amino acid transporter
MPFWPYPALFASFLVNARFVWFIVITLMSLWWFGWSGTVFLSSTRVIFAAAFDRMLPEGVSYIEPRTRTPIIALMLMVIPALIISFLYAYNIFSFVTLVLDATLVIAVTFWGTTLAAMILPWRSKEVYDGSPIAKYKMPSWLSYLMMLVFAIGGLYLIYTSFKYALTVLTNMVGLESLTVAMVLVVAMLTVVNAAVIVWLIYYLGKRILAGDRMPLITLASIVFFLFLDWLLVEWFWDPHVYDAATQSFAPATYAIGWSNATSMLFMIINYAVAAGIYLFFSYYRRRQGIDVNKVYKAIPVE